MTQLHKGYVNDSHMRHDGIGHWIQAGEPLTVNGTPFVNVGGNLIPAAGWYATRAEAASELALRIEDIGRRLLAQAEKLRQEALS